MCFFLIAVGIFEQVICIFWWWSWARPRDGGKERGILETRDRNRKVRCWNTEHVGWPVSWLTGPEGQLRPSTHSVAMGDGGEVVSSLYHPHLRSLSPLQYLFLSHCFLVVLFCLSYQFQLSFSAHNNSSTSRKVNNDGNWNNHIKGTACIYQCVFGFVHACGGPVRLIGLSSCTSLVGNVTEMCVINVLQALVHRQ